MISEKDMENAIAKNPKKYLGEDGLELIERQFRIGNYIFDLFFKDRHGAKLIVEIQKGTLDRNHTYKILDYYDGFKEKQPKEFIELMVVANRITAERKKRLHAMGVEFREVPESEFISDITVAETTAFHTFKKDFGKNLAMTDNDAIKSYKLFKEQKNLVQLQKSW